MRTQSQSGAALANFPSPATSNGTINVSPWGMRVKFQLPESTNLVGWTKMSRETYQVTVCLTVVAAEFYTCRIVAPVG